MASSIGNDTASSIVTTDTNALISQADSIIRACIGVNCNTSAATRTQITQQSSTLAQQQANNTLTTLGVPRNSILGRNINVAYLNLGSAVASVYNFQCGDSTANSNSCVSNASTVKDAQDTLRSLLTSPSTNDASNAIVISILSIVGFTSIMLFFIFLFIGIFGMVPSRTPIVNYAEPVFESPAPQPTIITPIVESKPISPPIATPASPFDQ